jgi:hypothetical protein
MKWHFFRWPSAQTGNDVTNRQPDSSVVNIPLTLFMSKTTLYNEISSITAGRFVGQQRTPLFVGV